jgi:pilus assembly protein CpaB
MRLGSTLMFLAAVVVAVMAGLLANTWLEQQRRLGQPQIPPSQIKTGQIVIATQALRFGAELAPAHLREIEWPSTAIPVGAFTSKAELLGASERRVVLSSIEANEPVLKWKITGPGQRASLSAIIDDGMKAVTIRVNDVFGVAGFVLPGDRVDVLLTRTDAQAEKKPFTDVLLQNVRVLAVDQLADDRIEKAAVAKAVTLEVAISDAQKIVLAGSVGSLSLTLRPAGSTAKLRTQRIGTDELGSPSVVAVSAPQAAAATELDRTGRVGVTRAVNRTEYTVNVENRVD